MSDAQGLDLRRGDRVRIRPAKEILATLDTEGDLDSLPFMPEMLEHCGGTYEVHARADKTCDTINLLGCNREMTDTVHLVGLRCDGSAHGGCQAGCLLFFREAWLERSEPGDGDQPDPDAADLPDDAREWLQATAEPEPGVFRCQATQLLAASSPAPRSYGRHYLRDLRTRNVPLRRLLRALAFAAFNRYQAVSRRFLPRALLIAGGLPYPFVTGSLDRTPSGRLDLQPGELVEVKSLPEITATLNTRWRNRGLLFDGEMSRYCGRRARVLRRIDRIIDEGTGRMMHMNSDCVVLEDVVCLGDYHRLCPRAISPYWREIWLKRVEAPPPSAAGIRSTHVGSDI